MSASSIPDRNVLEDLYICAHSDLPLGGVSAKSTVRGLLYMTSVQDSVREGAHNLFESWDITFFIYPLKSMTLPVENYPQKSLHP